MRPRISVYVVSHNYGHYLEHAVESVLRQTYDDWELMIFDDNSSDQTPQIMNLYRGDPRVRLFSTKGIGLPAVCNMALNSAAGEYIIRLDGDDVFDENILLVLANWLDRHSEHAMVFPDFFFIDEHGEIFGQERRVRVFDKNHALDMPPNGACCLIRRDVLLNLGGYREDLGRQDGFDIWVRMREQYQCANVNIPLFYYRRHSSNLTNRSNHILHARRRIKLDTVIDELDASRPILAVIPCRRNYDFCPDVWKCKINGKTLLQWNIEKCIRSRFFDRIIVASDNPEVQEIMKGFSDSRLEFFERDPQDTLRSKSVAFTLDKISRKHDPDGKGIIALSFIQAPFVTTAVMEEALSTLVLNKADCALGVQEIHDLLYRRAANGLQLINPPRGLTSDFDLVYRQVNCALASRSHNMRKGTLTGSYIVNFVVAPEECFFIDSEHDLRIAAVIAEDMCATA
jgi:CMP-N-acetylneuraminic acid synthetase